MRTLSFSFLFICLLFSSTVFSQWDKYPTFDVYITMMEKFGTDYPELCRIIEIGESVQGRKLLIAKVSDNAGTHEKEPGFLYLAAIHGDETLGYILMLHLIDYLLSNYGTDTLVTKLVDNIEIFIDPLVNPDGTYNSGNSTVTGARRYNANNVDLCRNFPGMPGGGPTPIPEKETEALMDFAKAQHLILSADLHSGSEMIIYPSRVFENCSTACVDNSWFNHICTEYSEIAFNASNGTYNLSVIPDSTIYSVVNGNWTYFALQYLHCRSIMLELSTQKLLPESQLSRYWDYNYKALLRYVEQALYGIQGTVTDSITGEPLNAKVFVENHDKDSSIVYSLLPHGDYYRPIFQGTYDVTFSADGYKSKTIKAVQIQNNEVIVLDVKLTKGSTGVFNKTENNVVLTVNNCNGFVRITYNSEFVNNMEISIVDVSGKVIRNVSTEKGNRNRTIVWNGLDNNGHIVSNGCYVIRVENKENIITKRFIFSR